MIDRKHDLSITKQAEVLQISRGSVYYLPRSVSSADIEITRQLDRVHLEYPFAGSRMLRGLLALQGCKIGRRHVKTLMKRMGIEALYRRPRTTKPEPGHKIHPYLLCGMEISPLTTKPDARIRRDHPDRYFTVTFSDGLSQVGYPPISVKIKTGRAFSATDLSRSLNLTPVKAR